MKSAAVKGIIPAGNKVHELRSNLFRLITEIPLVLETRFGEQGLAATAEIFQKLGQQDALIMKNRIGLGNTLKDAVDAWIIIGHIMGSKMDMTWESDTRAVSYHPYCPQYEEFKKNGKIYCETACWPYVGSIGENIAPGVKMEIVKPADMDHACTKALEYAPTKLSEYLENRIC